MPSSPLGYTIVELRRAWHAIIAFGQYKWSNNVGCGIPSSPLDYVTQSDGIERGMTSPSMDSTHGRTTSGMACHHRLWTAQMVERRPAWHAIIALGLADTVERRRAWHAIINIGQHRQSNDVGRGIPLSPLD